MPKTRLSNLCAANNDRNNIIYTPECPLDGFGVCLRTQQVEWSN